MAAYGGRWFGPGEVGDLMKTMKKEIDEARGIAIELAKTLLRRSEKLSLDGTPRWLQEGVREEQE